MNTLSSDQTAGRLVELLPKLLKGFSQKEKNPLAKGLISVPQMLALEYLTHVPRARMSELSRVLSIRMASATGLVDRLVKAGMVGRFSDPNDRRVVWIQIKPPGKKAITSILSERRKTMSNIFRKISESDQKQFIKTFERVCQILET